ncbi:GumC family protein [Altererythrobacter sp. MF3-039]|uniref:GumC family protein n=1 Tax=Altererythrobacter sp. MF3-039 TaxID=3252901 RepID=UPI00390C7909
MVNSLNDDFLEERRGSGGMQYPDGSQSSPFAAMVERYWIGFRKNIIFVGAIIATCLVGALILTLLATPQYTASSLIEINRDEANVTNVQGLESDDSNKDLEFYQTQYSLLEARSIAERVARLLGAVSDDRLFSAFDVDPELALTNQSVDGGKPPAVARMDLAVGILQENISIEPVRGSRLVNVNFTSPSADLSAEVANLWVQQFQEATVERRFESTDDAREFLEGRLAELRQRLEDSQRQLVSYAAQKEIIPLSDSRDVEGNTNTAETLRLSNLKALNTALSEATQARIVAESRMQQAASRNDASLSSPALDGIRERRAEVAAEIAQMRAIFEPEYPQVQALQSQLRALDQSILEEESRLRNAYRGSFTAALGRERELQGRVSAMKEDTLKERRDSIQFAIFQREVDTNRELYEALLQRYKEIGVAGVAANNIIVVDPAKVPENPSSPSLPLNLVLGLLSGLVLAGGFVFVREELDQSLKDPAQVSEALDLPLLGAIPQEEDEDVLEQLSDPKTQVSEAYLSAANNLAFATPHGLPRSFALASTRPNEGKSTSAYALAISFSRMGKRTILVDSDLRNASQHRFFGIENIKGLSNLLVGEEQGRISDFALRTEFPNLDLMPAGALPPNPGTLLSSGALGELVKKLNEIYDVVVVDGPPLLGLADGPLLARSVEGVVYNIEANGLRIRAISAGLRRLRFVDANIFGAIVTKLTSHNAAYGYGDTYGYGYKYGGQ